MEHEAESEKREMSEQAERLASERDVVAQDVQVLMEEDETHAARLSEEDAKLGDYTSTHSVAGSEARVRSCSAIEPLR